MAPEDAVNRATLSGGIVDRAPKRPDVDHFPREVQKKPGGCEIPRDTRQRLGPGWKGKLKDSEKSMRRIAWLGGRAESPKMVP